MEPKGSASSRSKLPKVSHPTVSPGVHHWLSRTLGATRAAPLNGDEPSLSHALGRGTRNLAVLPNTFIGPGGCTSAVTEASSSRLSRVSTHKFSIRRTVGADWSEIRELRLEMIRDTPTAYAETLGDALAHDEAEWRMRGERGTAEHGIAIAAISNTGRWIGTMGAFVPNPEAGPLLVGVYVAPEFRGRQIGLTDRLLEAIENWAHTESSQLTLHVHEDNVRARAYYERRGFTATGHTVAYNLDPTKKELEMVKQLSPQPMVRGTSRSESIPTAKHIA